MTLYRRPPLPAAPVDLDVLIDALDAGKSPQYAVAAATGEPLVTLAGKTKAQLLDIASAEGVAVEADATNAAIIDAIEESRAGPIVEPDAPEHPPVDFDDAD